MNIETVITDNRIDIREAINEFLERDKKAVTEFNNMLWFLGEREKEQAKLNFVSDRLLDACQLLVDIGNYLVDENGKQTAVRNGD